MNVRSDQLRAVLPLISQIYGACCGIIKDRLPFPRPRVESLCLQEFDQRLALLQYSRICIGTFNRKHCWRQIDGTIPSGESALAYDETKGATAEVAKAIVPDDALSSHVAPLGLAFSTGASLPGAYRGGAFVGEHGRWNRQTLNGY